MSSPIWRMAEMDRSRAAQLCSCASAKACVSLCESLAISAQSAEPGWCLWTEVQGLGWGVVVDGDG